MSYKTYIKAGWEVVNGQIVITYLGNKTNEMEIKSLWFIDGHGFAMGFPSVVLLRPLVAVFLDNYFFSLAECLGLFRNPSATLHVIDETACSGSNGIQGDISLLDIFYTV